MQPAVTAPVHAFRGAAPTRVGGWPQERLIFCGALASGVCLAMLAGRSWFVGRAALAFLTWNLFLAWVPLAMNALRALADLALNALSVPRATRWALLWPLDLGWLLFLPNAPYLVTDLVHLSDRPPMPYWLDLLMFCAFAGTGCWLGVVSLDAVLSRLRSKRLLAAVSVLTCLGCGYGVYLGRVLRLNSWDVVDLPSSLVTPLAQPGAAVFTCAFAGFFGLLMWVFRAAQASNVSSGDS